MCNVPPWWQFVVLAVDSLHGTGTQLAHYSLTPHRTTNTFLKPSLIFPSRLLLEVKTTGHVQYCALQDAFRCAACPIPTLSMPGPNAPISTGHHQ